MVKDILLARGAEAILYLDEEGNLVKERIKKGYRIPQLDERLRARRTRLESTLLREARRADVLTPQIREVEGYKIKMEFLDGHHVRGLLNEENCEEIAEKIGSTVAKLHAADIIHGDLTTSNMIIRNGELYIIDFGLGFQSKKAEDKAVDLYLLYHALESTHWQVFQKAWKIILKAYTKNYDWSNPTFGRQTSSSGKVIKTLAQIEKRGRYKER